MIILKKIIFTTPFFNIDKLGASGIVSSTFLIKFSLSKGVVDGEVPDEAGVTGCEYNFFRSDTGTGSLG